MRKKGPKIGLALGAGGARGLAHIGVLKTLEKEGIIPDCIAGVSMGSLVGAYYCLGQDLDELEKEVLAFNRRRALKKLVDPNNPKKSLIKGKKIEKYINETTGGATFRNLKKPFKVVTTDLESGKEIILEKGNLTKALLASISVPGIFPPVKIYGKHLVDGGVVNFTPTDVVEDMGADLVIGVDLIIRREAKLDKSPSILSSLIQSYEIVRSQGAKLKNKDHKKELVMIEPKIKGTIDSFKFYKIERFIQEGERAAKKALPQIKRKLKKLEKQFK